MLLQLWRFFDRFGETKDIDYKISLEELAEYGGCDFIVTPVSVKGRIENHAGMVTLDYESEFSVRRPCDRCLDEFERDYHFDFSCVLAREETSESEDAVVCKNGELDFNELVISDLLLSLPTKALCRDDCKGLCQKCWQNLNHGPCSCGEGSAVTEE